ncbi:MAG: FAD-dependent oxidoreductase [Ignavibacteriales bacterium]|nr:FAD-dependent oxidoreductase [Ignavibacteriales bacterium]
MNLANSHKPRVVILGGGFAGVYAAMELESQLANRDDFEITLVNKENYFVFQPMLPEVISGSIGILDTVSPIRRLLPKTRLIVRDVEALDLQQKNITLSQGFRPRPYSLQYDYLVFALGNVTDFRGMVGLPEHALPFKNLADAIFLRNHVIHVLEEAGIESDPELRQQLLTFVIAGGGFSGVEVCAELNDFVRHAAKLYRGIEQTDIRVVLLHSSERILDREVSKELGLYAEELLYKRGVEIRLKTRLRSASSDAAILTTDERIPTKTLVSTVPSSPHPLIDGLDIPKDKGKIKCNGFLEVESLDGVWAVGDCALIPNPSGEGFCPPTAQYAIREGTTAARNIVVSVRGGQKKQFQFKGLGKMGSLGYRSAVAELFDYFRFSGFLAWFLWRTIYLWKLPGLDRKIKVGLAWALDLLIPPELVQLKLGTAQGVAQAHFEPGEVVFRQGDLGDSLYILLRGEAEVVREDHGEQKVIAHLQPGEFFGEMALLNQKTRWATIRCIKPTDVLTVKKGDFTALVANLPDMRQTFENVMAKRMGKNK